MAKKKSIGSRYSIEYAYPDSPENNKPRKKWPLYVLGVLALGGVSTFVIPFKSIESFVTSTFDDGFKHSDSKHRGSKFIEANPATTTRDSNSIEELVIDELPEEIVEVTENTEPTLIKKDKLVEVIEVDVEKLLLDNQKHLETSQEQLAKNQLLTEKLNLLSQQLLAEKEKNQKLSAQINAQESNNNKLTTLLDEAMKSASADDQKYIAELSALNTKQYKSRTFSEAAVPKKETSVQVGSTNITAINDQVAKLVATTLEPKKDKIIDYNNSISVSTASQVDAIILAMQDIQNTRLTLSSTNNANPKLKENTVSIKVSTQKSNDSSGGSLFIDLQNQINALLEPKKQKTDTYKEALKKESGVRINAMRSIIVKKGETLWSIAVRAYGNGSLYTKIIEANPHISVNGKVVLSIGQVIRVPI